MTQPGENGMGEERAREVLILSGMHESTNQAIGLVPHHIVMRAMLAFADEARLAERAECAAIADRVASECASDAEFIKRDGDGEPAMAFGGKIEAGRVAHLIRERSLATAIRKPHP